MYATHLWIIYDYVLLKISEVLAILHNILYVMTTRWPQKTWINSIKVKNKILNSNYMDSIKALKSG